MEATSLEYFMNKIKQITNIDTALNTSIFIAQMF